MSLVGRLLWGIHAALVTVLLYTSSAAAQTVTWPEIISADGTEASDTSFSTAELEILAATLTDPRTAEELLNSPDRALLLFATTLLRAPAPFPKPAKVYLIKEITFRNLTKTGPLTLTVTIGGAPAGTLVVGPNGSNALLLVPTRPHNSPLEIVITGGNDLTANVNYALSNVQNGRVTYDIEDMLLLSSK